MSEQEKYRAICCELSCSDSDLSPADGLEFDQQELAQELAQEHTDETGDKTMVVKVLGRFLQGAVWETP